jgi:hypothetical protein
MPIEVTCGCGRVISVPDAHAGKRGKCPSCGSVVFIPTAPQPEPDEDLASVLKRAAPPTPPPAPTPVYRDMWGNPAKPPAPPDPSVQKVNLVDAGMPFESMCWFIFKWSLAAIPTVLAFSFVSWIFWAIVTAILHGPPK